MLRIVTVYKPDVGKLDPVDMSFIRWLKISQALAGLGHQVDIATRGPRLWRPRAPALDAPGIRRVHLERVEWETYDVVKTLFHGGYRTLERFGGTSHPYIISKLGSVVGNHDRPDVYFFGKIREELLETQQKIASSSRYVTLLTDPSRALFAGTHGRTKGLLKVPGAVDAVIPPPGADPYDRAKHRHVCLFAGNFYTPATQPEAHRTLVEKMNALGRALRGSGIGFHVMGPGESGGLDPSAVTCLGPVRYEDSWRYLQHADVGVVLALGQAPNQNESTKIYHYLRVGLPVVCETGFPNESLIRETECGLVTRNGDMALLADAAVTALATRWPKEETIDHILRHHTWEARAKQYEEVFIRDGLVDAKMPESVSRRAS